MATVPAPHGCFLSVPHLPAGCRPQLGSWLALVPAPPAKNRMWCEEVCGVGWGVASGQDFLKLDRFTTVSWAQDRTAVSYKCPCQSQGWEALLSEKHRGSPAPTLEASLAIAKCQPS